jgi:hypothetical protein
VWHKIIQHSLVLNSKALLLHRHNLLAALHKLHKQQMHHHLVPVPNKVLPNKVPRLVEEVQVSWQ